jgi:adenylate cyclase
VTHDPHDEITPLRGELHGKLRDGRAKLVAELLEHGYTTEQLQEAIAADRLAVLPLEGVLRETASLTAAEVADRTGIDAAEVLRSAHLLGLPAAGFDEPAFGTDICDALQALHGARAVGVSQAAIDELLTSLGHHMWHLVADIMLLLGNEFARRGDSEYELAHRYADAARFLVPTATPVVTCAFTAHLRDRMKDTFVTPEEAEHGALRAMADVAVAFVDVVGFTALGERVDGGELKSIANRLANLANDVIEPPVRLVKIVGDAILLMSRDSLVLCDALVKIMENASADPQLPPIHIGAACGEAHIGGGDVYGTPVNIASRLTDLTPSLTIWTSNVLATRVEGSHHLIPRGAHPIRGTTEVVDVFELRPS